MAFDFSGFADYADSPNVGGAYGSDTSASGGAYGSDTSASGGSDQPVNDPFSYYDPSTGGYTNTPGWSPGEYESTLAALTSTPATPDARAAELAAVGVDINNPFPDLNALVIGGFFPAGLFAPPAPAPVTEKEVLELPDEEEAGLKEVVDFVKGLFTPESKPTTPTTPAPTTTNPAGAPNVVGTPVSGGYLVDSFGNPVTSKSYGLPGEYVPESPQLPADTLAAAAAARNMTVDQLREVVDAEQQSGASLAATGLDYDTLEALQSAGLGGLEISPTQTVDQALAAKTAQEYLTEYAPTIFGALTGFGPQMNAIKAVANVVSGKTTPGQAILGVGLGALADKIGIPPQTLSNIAQGRLGDAAGSLATGAATGLLGSQLGLGPFSGPAAGIIMKETGLGPLIGSNVDRAVTDVVPDQNWNLLNTVGGGIDQVLKDMGLPVYSDTQYRGEPITPSLPSLPGASDYGNFYESGDSGQGSSTPTPTTPTTPEPPKQEQTITLQPRMALQPEIYQGRYGPLMRYNYVPVGD